VKIFGLEIRRTGAQPVSDNRTWWPLVREPYTGAWQRNQEIRTETVVAHHAVYACVTRIAQDVAKLRPRLVVEQEDGIWTEAWVPAFSNVLERPNRFQNYLQFREWWMTSKLLHGNAYALLERADRRTVRAMYVLDPHRVKVLVAPDGEVFYELKTDNLAGLQEESVSIPASEIVHDRINCLFHPLVGTSPIFASGMAATVGLNIERNSADFFANGSNPSGLLSTPVTITAQKAKELSELWDSQYSGPNSGRVAVLGDGMRFEAMRMGAAESQLIEQLKWSAETVAATFHVPAFKIGAGSAGATYQDPALLNHIYYSDCLQIHIEAWELCMDEALGLRTRKDGGYYGVELDLDGLLRMDAKTQVATLTDGIKGGLYTPNEARAKVDKTALPGGDTVYLQQQMYSLAALAERDESSPFAKPEPPVVPPVLPPADDARAMQALALEIDTLALQVAA
jgi:HK97 family phage portal protein